MVAAPGFPDARLGGNHQQLAAVVTAELRRRILTLGLAPGDHLVESRLAVQLGVSRNPVREAIRVLATEGFAEISPRRGAFVASCSPKDAEDMFQVRLVLEPLGAQLAALRADGQGIAALENTIGRARQATESGELDLVADLNTEFHCLLMQMSGNPYLESIAIPTIKRAQWMYRQNAATRAPHSWSEHAGLLQAIREGDADAAVIEARHHVTAARRSFRSHAASLA